MPVPQLLPNVPLDVVLPTMSPISADQADLQTISADLPPYWDYLELRNILQGIDTSNIQEYRVMLNGAPWIRLPGATLDVGINRYFGAPAYAADSGAGNANQLTHFLRRLGIKTGSGTNGAFNVPLPFGKDLAYATSINAGVLNSAGNGVRNFRIEVDLVNTPNTPCSMQVQGLVLPQDPNAGGSGLLPRWDRQSLTVSANQVVNLARPYLQFGDAQHEFFFGLLLVPASGTLNTFRLRHNGVEKMIRTAANNATVQATDRVRFPQAGYYWLDISERGYGDEVLPIGDPGTDFQVQFTPSADGPIQIYQFGAGSL